MTRTNLSSITGLAVSVRRLTPEQAGGAYNMLGLVRKDNGKIIAMFGDEDIFDCNGNYFHCDLALAD